MSSGSQHRTHFVVAAIVASELHKAMLVARQIALTASNARALALRAGQGAAGFRAITEFIDDLASKTVEASQQINGRAIVISRMASESARVEATLDSFKRAYTLAEDAEFLTSLAPAYSKIEAEHVELKGAFEQQVQGLHSDLEELSRELRTAAVLSTMSRVEASQSGKQFEQPLSVIASNVGDAAGKIQNHVRHSQQLFAGLS
ncbi:hypothetical protein NBRC116494_34870 [Aurantivibrio plasticivorans]